MVLSEEDKKLTEKEFIEKLAKKFNNRLEEKPLPPQKTFNKKQWLGHLYYNIGKQVTNFRLTSTFKVGEEIKHTKWVPYLTLQANEGKLQKSNQRELLKNEIVLDLDTGDYGSYLALIQRLRDDRIKFYAYATSEHRSRHIHTFWKELALLTKSERESIRLLLIQKYGCDENLKSDAHVVSLEYCEHWKTGKVKELVDKEEGTNSASSFIDTIKNQKNKSSKVIVKSSASGKLLMLDDYSGNVNLVWQQRPFFFDKAKLFWVWNKEQFCWEIVDETDTLVMIDKELGFAGQLVTTGFKSNYLEAFRQIGRKNTPPPNDQTWVQFKNQIIDIKSNTSFEATPKYFSTNPLPQILGVSSDTPVMDALFESWVGKEYAQTLYEIIAYCCLPDYPIHAIFCFTGSGRNGKSTFLELIRRFIGQPNCCSADLQELANSRFGSLGLYKKLVCFIGETDWDALQRSAKIKQLCGGDLIKYEPKGKQQFEAKNYAKIIVSTNSLPASLDTTDGYFRRWFVIPFPNEFDIQKDILETIPQEEYANLARKCVQLLPKILETKNFTGWGNIENRKRQYMFHSNPVKLFIEQFCYRDEQGFVRFSELYLAYARYLLHLKRRVVSRKEFSKVLDEEGLESRKTAKRSKMGEWENAYYVEGISILENWKERLVKSGTNRSNDNPSYITTYLTNLTNLTNNIILDSNSVKQNNNIVEEDILKNNVISCSELKNVSNAQIGQIGQNRSNEMIDTAVSEKDILFWVSRFGNKDQGINIEELKEAMGITDEQVDRLKRNGKLVEQVAGKVKVL